jgi:hypothetical protein
VSRPLDLAHLRLDRRVLDRSRAIDALDGGVRLLERPLDVALADLPAVHLALEVRVPVAPLMDLRSVRVERLADVEQSGALLEADLDRVDRLGRELLARGCDDGDRLAEIAHLVLREQRLVRRDAERGQVAVLQQRYVFPGDDRVHAGHRLGLGRVEVRDSRVVMRGAEGLCPERSRDAHVVDVGRASGDVRDAVIAGDSCADDLHSAPPVAIVVYFPTAVVVRSKESPRAAAATASMIFE